MQDPDEETPKDRNFNLLKSTQSMHNHKSVHEIRINKKGQQKEEKLLTNLNKIQKMVQCVTQWYQKNNNFELISQIQ